MLFEKLGLVYVMLPVIAVLMIVSLTWRSRIKAREKDALSGALKMLKLNTLTCGAFCLFLWFVLPMTSSLSTFGFPQRLEQVQSGPQLLALLQTYNRALVRTTDVMFWFLFVFVWWFLSSYHDFAKAITSAMHRHPEGTPQAR